MMTRLYLTTYITLFWAALAVAQKDVNPVSWKMEVKTIAEDNANAEVRIAAEIQKNWQLYSNDFSPELGPMVTEFNYVHHPDVDFVGETVAQDAHRKYDDLWGGEYTYFEENARFIQKIKSISSDAKIECTITYQVCNTIDGKCIPYDITLNNY